MKFTNLFFLLTLMVILHFSLSLAYAQNQTINSANYYGGNVYSYNISADDLSKTPSWKPEREDPPVSLRNALEIARKNLNRFVKKSDRFEVADINLMQMDGNKWLYNISFDCRKKECQDAAESSFSLFIKMDGSIIEPKIRPEVNSKEVFTIPVKPKVDKPK